LEDGGVRLLHVKNWAQFQHYGNRNPIWIKVYLSLLDDYDFSKLTDAEAGQLVKLWLFAAKSKVKGAIPYDAEWITKQVNATQPIDLDRFLAMGWLADESVLAHSDNTVLAQPEPYPNECASVEEKRREEKREETSPRVRGWPEFELAVPPDYRDAIEGAMRAANDPDALRRQLVAMQEAITGGAAYSPAVIGQAIHELAVAGSRVTAAGLRAFCRRIAAGDRETTTTNDAAAAWAKELKGAA